MGLKYAANAPQKRDLNKNITSISYNSLNLPDVVTFAGGNTVTYGYDAAGGKLSVAYKSGANVAKTKYVGNKVYKNGTLSMILTKEGYVTLSGAAPTYHYYLKEHQGNHRVVISQSGAVEQVSHYYPFGGLFGEGVQTSNQPYKYNGKELDRFQNLDMYDYGARHYDAAVGRWGTPDPLAEKYYGTSPYVYCGNNPVNRIDPDGREIFITGALSQEALQQLQNKVGNSITLSLNDQGKVSYTANTEGKLKGDAKRVAGMISDSKITVNLATTSENQTSTGNLMIGGAFMGNTVTKNADGSTSVSAQQEVNPNVLGAADAHTKTPEKMMMHEVTESYEGAKISQKSGISSPRAGVEGSVYESAHNKATGQSTVTQRMFDAQGREVYDASKAVRVEWSVSKGGKERIIQTLP